MPQRITEAQTLTVAETAAPGRIRLQLIDSGWGSSGYYSATVLENAATDRVFPAGTQVFFDHPGEMERHDRPERSVRDLAAVLDEDATFAGGALLAEARVIGPYRELITDPVFMEAVGMSIRASADTTVGEAEGRKGTLVTNLLEGVSVDLVTRAGRGGRILAAVESARADLTEATTDEVRTALAAATFEHDSDSYVSDYDPDQGVVYVHTFGQGPGGMHRHPYTYDAPTAVIDWATSTEVRPVTSYVPVPDPNATAGDGTNQPPVNPAGSTQESEEDTMPQIEESRLAQLEADAGRATTAESERDTAQRERDEAREALNARDRVDTACPLIERAARDAGVTFTTLEQRGLLADLPVTEAGDLDKDALTAAATEAATDKAATYGAGRITGFGHSGDGEVTEADVDKTLAGVFGRKEA